MATSLETIDWAHEMAKDKAPTSADKAQLWACINAFLEDTPKKVPSLAVLAQDPRFRSLVTPFRLRWPDESLKGIMKRLFPSLSIRPQQLTDGKNINDGMSISPVTADCCPSPKGLCKFALLCKNPECAYGHDDPTTLRQLMDALLIANPRMSLEKIAALPIYTRVYLADKKAEEEAK